MPGPSLDHFSDRLLTGAARLTAQRACSPEETFARVEPHLTKCGVTRAASVTGLDDLGIPTWVAVRPDGLILQVSNGKGLTDAAARVSAIMESIELFHAETPDPNKLHRASLADLQANLAPGDRVLHPESLPGWLGGYWSDTFVAEWTPGIDHHQDNTVWIPSSAVYFRRSPCLHEVSSNGLASGNTIDEAALHALYELIERDAMCRLRDSGVLRVQERAGVVDLASLTEPILRMIVDRCQEAGTKVVLMYLPGAVPVHTFWAVFLDTRAIASVSTVNTGWGCHADLSIAATRALTEAAQSRLGFIHGARDDVIRKPIHSAEAVKTSRTFRFFESLKPNVDWTRLPEQSGLTMPDRPHEAVDLLCRTLRSNGLGPVTFCDLTHADKQIPVVRALCPGLGFNKKLF